MKNSKKLFGIIVLAAVMVLVASCVTASSIGGTAEGHGRFTFSVPSITDGFMQIASYNVIMGLFDTGYSSYATAVKAAEAEGKQITTVTKSYYFLATTTAYAK